MVAILVGGLFLMTPLAGGGAGGHVDQGNERAPNGQACEHVVHTLTCDVGVLA